MSEPSDTTKRMAKTLGTEWVPNEPAMTQPKPEGVRELVEELRIAQEQMLALPTATRHEMEMLTNFSAEAIAHLYGKCVTRLERLGGVERVRAALFEPIESDASLNLQGVLDDLRGQANPNDGDVCARSVDRVIDQLENARAAIDAVIGSVEGG